MPKKPRNLGTPMEVIEAVKNLSGQDQLNLYDLIANWQMEKMRKLLKRKNLHERFNRDHLEEWVVKLEAKHFRAKDSLYFSLKVSGKL